MMYFFVWQDEEIIQVKPADTYSLDSLATIDVDRMANKNQDRLDRLHSFGGKDDIISDTVADFSLAKNSIPLSNGS